MNKLLSKVPELSTATVEEKLAMIDELWESIRRAGEVPLPDSHLTELDRRVSAVLEEPGSALSPDEARALFRK